MNDNERRVIVWDLIERLAFRPIPPANWLSVYARTLYTFWGLETKWVRFSPNHCFDIPFLMLKCKFSIQSVDKYSVSLKQDSSIIRCYWQNHIDPTYPSKGSLNSASSRYPHQQSKQMQGDIEAVLDGMIFHPRCHTHLEDLCIQQVQLDQDKGAMSPHEVRIGGGIENPYVFLFHLRYQFCLVSDKIRQDERDRLIELFKSAISRNEKTVNPNRLFEFSRQR